MEADAEGARPWFETAEFRDRVARVQAVLRARGLDALLAFQPESVTWLTGFFTRGYSTYQFALIPAEGDPSVFCRDVARYYLERTCVFSDHGVWADGEDVPAAAASFIAARLGASARVAVEMEAWQMTAARWFALAAALPGLRAEAADGLVGRLRLVKSPAEIAYQRAAARAAEAGMAAARATAGAGVSERDVAAAIVAAMIRAGSDHPGPGPLSSGERAFHLHGGFTDRVLRHGDTLQCECTPAVRHYHARFMRTIKIGTATQAERDKLAAIIAVQDEALAAVAPGVPATVPDRIYREGILSRGLRKDYTNKTFYSVGLMMPPVGGEPLEASPHATWNFEPGMVFHTYVLADSFGFSETIAITETGYERLTTYPRELIVTPERST
ncbi:Xaa-Pro peptidase family protein [uncultured Alsobacter sp.]|uniref:M24 family metallopeptidase n=1 Tax=uncultured Alsobacter sp. TaxID=1748258 RepID=UPI0025D28A4A|nr:Xaa-Pro peptidase family protein [uncultured Alsobacter sp.]